MKHWQRAFALGSLLLSAYVVGCGAGEEPRPLSGATPVLEISASSQATRATSGVERWQVHEVGDDLSTRLVGLDGGGRAIVDAELHIELAADGSLAAIVLEGVFPEHGMIRLAADGTLVSSAIPEDGASVRAFRALVDDLAAFDETAADKHPRSLSCNLAKAKMVLMCAGAVVACVLSGGNPLTCVGGAGSCLSAVQNYLCKCKGQC